MAEVASMPAASAEAAGLAGASRTLSGAFAHYHVLHMLAALFPTAMGVALYGWRVIGVIALLSLSVGGAMAVWRKLGARGMALHWPHVLWLSILLALMFPVHLLDWEIPWMKSVTAPWAILASAGVLLVILTWVLGGEGFAWVHPLLVTYLAIYLLYPTALAPHAVLHRSRMVMGRIDDLGHAQTLALPTPSPDDAWASRREALAHDAVYVDRTAAQWLTEYTHGGRSASQRGFMSLDSFLREKMPPLEDLVIGGHPSAIGSSSAIAVIIGGLFLMYRGAIGYRIPLFMILSAYLAFLILPVPVVINEDGAQWRALAFRRPGLDWATIITFANYELLASPLLLTAFFIATSPAISPSARSARTLFAILAGLMAAAAQLYLAVSVGPYVAVLVAGLLSPWLDERAQAGSA